MIKKIMISMMVLSIMLVMVGTAAANPEDVNILLDGSSTLAPNPIILDNTGVSNNYDLKFSGYYTGTIYSSHTLTVTLKALDGANLANNEIKLTAKESDGIAGSISSTGTSNTLVLTYVWDQDSEISDTIDFEIISYGPDGRSYQIDVSDIGGTSANGFTDRGAANRGATNIPEFPTIALPIAAIVGLMFIISSRKKKE